MHNIVNNIVIAQSLMPQTITSAPLHSGNVDTQGVEAVTIVLLVGDMADTLSGSVKVAARIEHADDDGAGSPGAYGACTDEDVLNFTGLSSGVFTTIDEAAKDQKRYAIGYRGGKRFVKVTATPTGLTNGGPIAIVTLKGNPTQLPVSNS